MVQQIIYILNIEDFRIAKLVVIGVFGYLLILVAGVKKKAETAIHVSNIDQFLKI